MKRKKRPQAEAYLNSRTRLGVKFGLETIRALVESLGHPERAYDTLLVAGTNGKGSVVAYCDAALREAGLRVGRYTSPHLVDLRERIVVDGRLISRRALERAVGEVYEAAESLVASRAINDHPTYFEAVTAAAFVHFRRAGVDVAVLEVGMGGRLDATNVSEPLASAIVSIARDHEAFLGSSLRAIAGEKAGVLRKGRTTVVGPLPEEASLAVQEASRRIGARLLALPRGPKRDTSVGVPEPAVAGRLFANVRPLPGAHQRANVLVAIRLLQAARAAGLSFDMKRAARGLSKAVWPGRLQWLRTRPPILLDGAHNPAGAQALARHLAGTGPFVLVFGAMEDKDIRGIARALFPLAAEIVLTRPKIRRAASARTIARLARGTGGRAHLTTNVTSALALARKLAKGRPIVAAGSLYLVGEILEAVRVPRTMGTRG